MLVLIWQLNPYQLVKNLSLSPLSFSSYITWQYEQCGQISAVIDFWIMGLFQELGSFLPVVLCLVILWDAFIECQPNLLIFVFILNLDISVQTSSVIHYISIWVNCKERHKIVLIILGSTIFPQGFLMYKW
jgi:hypothetical protein